MSGAIPPEQFPPWMGKVSAGTSGVAMALGQIEEAIGLLDQWVLPIGVRLEDREIPIEVSRAYEALVRVRKLLRQEVGS